MKSSSKLFTIGYIKHNQSVFDKFLGPSIENLKGEFDVICVSDEAYPAENYNALVDMASTPYVILTHQDISFSSDMLQRLQETIEFVGDFGAIGAVGVDQNRTYRWSQRNNIFELDTADCCFIVVRKDSPVKFDDNIFNEYHLYVEDYCAQINRIWKKKIYTFDISATEESPLSVTNLHKSSSISHHSITVNQRGCAWGKYWEYRQLLENKWPNIKTT